MIVTDYKWKDESGEIKQGYYMDGKLTENLSEIVPYLDKGFDSVGIISGSNRTGVGKTTFAFQVGFFIAWLIAGGKMDLRKYEDSNIFIHPVVLKKPNKPVRFNLDNVVFSPGELMKTARKLPRRSVIIYDEGRAGVDSRSVMTALNRELEEFFQVCRIYGHVFIIVIPNAFKLHEDYFVSRADWLLDTYLVNNCERGNFRYWSRDKKEALYVFGKKLLSASRKYKIETPNFFGSFTKLFMLDQKEYEKKKLKALKQAEKTQRGYKMKVQRDAWVYLCKKLTNKSHKELSEEISKELNKKIGEQAIDRYIRENKAFKEGKEYEDEDFSEDYT